MAIPRKEPVKANLLKDIAELPKFKLVGLSCALFCSSLGLYYYFSDYRKHIKRIEHIREVERVRGLPGTRPVNQDPRGTARPFSRDYGLDFDAKKAQDS